MRVVQRAITSLIPLNENNAAKRRLIHFHEMYPRILSNIDALSRLEAGWNLKIIRSIAIAYHIVKP